VAEKTRDTEGRLSVRVEFYYPANPTTVLHEHTFLIERGTNRRLTRAIIKGYMVVEEEKTTQVNELDSQLAIGEKVV
jgi:hypothetical protein